MNELGDLFPVIKTLQRPHCGCVRAACEHSAIESLSAVAKEETGDTIYAVDKINEELILDFFEREIATHTPTVLIRE